MSDPPLPLLYTISRRTRVLNRIVRGHLSVRPLDPRYLYPTISPSLMSFLVPTPFRWPPDHTTPFLCPLPTTSPGPPLRSRKLSARCLTIIQQKLLPYGHPTPLPLLLDTLDRRSIVSSFLHSLFVQGPGEGAFEPIFSFFSL